MPAAPRDSAEAERLARAAAEAAVGSAWAFFTRTAAQGLDWDDIHGCASPTDYRARLAAEPGLLLETCQALLDYDTGLTDTERADCRRVAAIADALALRGPAPLAVAEPPAPVGPAATEPAAAAEPPEAAPVPAKGGAGRWIGAALLLAGTVAALAWLWDKQPGAAPVLPRSTPTAVASEVVPATRSPQSGLPEQAPAPRVTAAARAEPTESPSPHSSPRVAPAPEASATAAARPKPVPTSTPMPAAAPPAPGPASPQPAATAG